MATSIETIHKDLSYLKKDMEFIKNILSESVELSESARTALKKARQTPESKYVDL